MLTKTTLYKGFKTVALIIDQPRKELNWSRVCYLIAHPDLKHRSVFRYPLSRPPRMLVAQLDEIAKDGHPGDLGQIFDLGNVGLVEVADEEEQDGDDGDRQGLEFRNAHSG